MFKRVRAGLLVSALVGAAIVAPVTVASATGSCGTGPVISTYTSGSVYYYDRDDWYRANSGGTALVALATTSTTESIDMYVYDATCGTLLCSSGVNGLQSESCAATNYAGTINIRVNYYSSFCCITNPYYLTVASPPAAGGTDCSEVQGVDTCVTREMGDVEQRVDVYGVVTYTAATHRVAGWVDVYRFALPNGAAVTLPCVVLTVNARTDDPCATADGTFVTRLATLVDQTANQPGVELGPPIASASVCNARYTVTVSAIGVEDFPAYALC